VQSPSKRNGSGPSPLMVSDGTCAQSDGTGFQSVGACVLSDVVPSCVQILGFVCVCKRTLVHICCTYRHSYRHAHKQNPPERTTRFTNRKKNSYFHLHHTHSSNNNAHTYFPPQLRIKESCTLKCVSVGISQGSYTHLHIDEGRVSAMCKERYVIRKDGVALSGGISISVDKVRLNGVRLCG